MKKGLSRNFSRKDFSRKEENEQLPFQMEGGRDETAKAILLRRLFLAAFPFDIFAEFVDPVGLGKLGFFLAGGPGAIFRRTVQDDDDHLRFIRFPPPFLGTGVNFLPELGIEFQEKVHQLPEGLG
jgi:hypothetical protein